MLFICLIGINVHGQTDSTNTPSDTSIAQTDTSDIEVIISTEENEDSTVVRIGNYKIIVLNGEDNQPKRIVIDGELGDDDDDMDYDDDEDYDYDDDDDDCDDDNVSHWAGVRIGVNGYLHNDGLFIPSSHDFLELDYGRSISWDLNLFEKDFRLYKQHVELVTGLGMHFASYEFKTKYQTLSNTDPLSTTVDSTRILNKNRLKATYLTAPLMLGFSTHKDEDKAFRLAMGGQVSWRIGSKLKQQYNQGGQTYKPKVKSDYDLNPFLFHAVASVGYGPINIYANYGLNSLFEPNKTLNVAPLI